MPKETMTITRDLFDEMLQAATNKERERIIKLLEQLEVVGSDPETADYIWTEQLIALIKGENK